ncbi:formate/nitrite transporter family protein [Sphingomonas sp. HT-1]|uniref:formate/nitrite transporter family protein n=1 Tax=unclassified Sphingomonas TaxID=196159 RepID=UPI000306F9CA|nr:MULTISPECIES: formate/nitrite transporter family protein [unclassified Sphingomonas]KTF70658.1 formate/nitrite transporter family protein [Sphingomonas sp. WG]
MADAGEDPTPKEIAAGAPDALAAKVDRSYPRMLVLAMLAGALIGFGSIGYLIVQAGPGAPSGAGQLLSGLAFSVGLMLVMVTGAELFTGNTMFVLPAAEGRLSAGRMIVAWTVVWIGNLLGSAALAAAFVAAGGAEGVDGGVAAAAVRVATEKVGKGAGALLLSGMLANMLVCLAVWGAMTATSVSSKVLAIVGPVTLFVAAGFEHSIANQSLLPIGWLVQSGDAVGGAGIAYNLALSTVGNIAGGAVVALGLGFGQGKLGAEHGRS